LFNTPVANNLLVYMHLFIIICCSKKFLQ